ncbi:MAG: M2 family metallopeptidase [Lysobacterales bacterium]
MKTPMTMLAASLTLLLGACNRDAATSAVVTTTDGSASSAPATPSTPAPQAKGSAAEADAFIARINDTLRKDLPGLNSAQWLASTYINDDSQMLASQTNERFLEKQKEFIAESRKFDGVELSVPTARAIKLLRTAMTLPPPDDAAKLTKLTQLTTKLDGMYGAGTFCTNPSDKKTCRQLPDLEKVLRDPASSYAQQLEAWNGWQSIAVPMRPLYAEFVTLSNQGAKDNGFADTGALWRSGYDMEPDAFQAETDRLWGQVKPLYQDLHCYTREKLVAKYGEQGAVNGLLPAHLMGNMWQQDWGNLWPILEPYQNAGSLDITSVLAAQRDNEFKRIRGEFQGTPTAEELIQIGLDADLAIAKSMTTRAEDFYVSLGMPKLPASFWEKSQFLKPRDREVVCHASAWDMNLEGDVRIKMCIAPNEEDFTTLYHELGHLYYDLAYNPLPPMFQNAAHDGFHEAIGDTIVLGVTPGYLSSVGLIGAAAAPSNESVINAQMRMALAKVAFLPFGLMIDRWRWGVFDGSITADNYNDAWWDLKAQYQGVAPATPRGEENFDPGAKYHVPGNTPYTRYFLAHILQFQFYKSLCDAAGFKGPLHECTYYGSAEAGKRYSAMLSKGAGQPWQQTLKELTGGEQMDASAILAYFAPLSAWLKEQNAGKSCGWEPNAATAPMAAASPPSS